MGFFEELVELGKVEILEGKKEEVEEVEEINLEEVTIEEVPESTEVVDEVVIEEVLNTPEPIVEVKEETKNATFSLIGSVNDYLFLKNLYNCIFNNNL
jgi:hypothetical protein